MAEYIERDKALKAFITKDIREMINAIPAADVQPVRRGYWKKTNDIFYRYCSVCGTKTDIAYSNVAKFCPKCGAKMDLPEATKG